MSKKEALIALWRLLAELFDDKAKASRLAEQSGVNPAQVKDDGAPADYWWRMLVETHRRNKVQEIVKNASWEVEERATDLKQAYRTYADAPDTEEALDAPTVTPGQIGGITIGKIEAVNVGETQFIDQRNATINVGAKKVVHTGGGAFIGGGVHTGGGHFVGRDMTVQGDVVGGDKISVGDVSGTGVAIGSGAHVQMGLAADVAQALAPVLAAVQTNAADAATQAAAMQEIETLKAELAKGKDADDSRIVSILGNLAKLAPGAVAAVVSAFSNLPLTAQNVTDNDVITQKTNTVQASRYDIKIGEASHIAIGDGAHVIPSR